MFEPIASVEEYKQALLKLRDNKKFRTTKYLDMLRAQYYSKDHAITSTQIAKEVGFKNYNASNLQYGTMSHEIAKYLNFKPEMASYDHPMWFFTLSIYNEEKTDNGDGHFEFIMRAELIQGLEEMKWVKK
jgi:hypothetical protein